jgi:hypothetical protein
MIWCARRYMNTGTVDISRPITEGRVLIESAALIV